MKIFEHRHNWSISLDCQLKYLFFITLHCRSQCLRLYYFLYLYHDAAIWSLNLCVFVRVYIPPIALKIVLLQSLIARFMGVNMGPIWGREAPSGPHVGPMNFAIWGFHVQTVVQSLVILLLYHTYASVRPVLCLLLIKLVKLIKMALIIISGDSALWHIQYNHILLELISI